MNKRTNLLRTKLQRVNLEKDKIIFIDDLCNSGRKFEVLSHVFEAEGIKLTFGFMGVNRNYPRVKELVVENPGVIIGTVNEEVISDLWQLHQAAVGMLKESESKAAFRILEQTLLDIKLFSLALPHYRNEKSILQKAA